LNRLDSDKNGGSLLSSGFTHTIATTPTSPTVSALATPPCISLGIAAFMAPMQLPNALQLVSMEAGAIGTDITPFTKGTPY
jgi:hypothetical protein